MKHLIFIASVFGVFLSSFSKNNDGLDFSNIYYNDAIDNDTIALHSPVNLRLNDFIYNPYGFLKPKYKELTYTELLRYLTTYHPELSINEETEGDKLILRIKKLKAWSGKDIEIKATFDKDGKIIKYGVSTKPPLFGYDTLMNELKKRGYKDVKYERKDYWHYVKAHRSSRFRYSESGSLYCNYAIYTEVFYPVEIECYFYNCDNSAYLIFNY